MVAWWRVEADVEKLLVGESRRLEILIPGVREECRDRLLRDFNAMNGAMTGAAVEAGARLSNTEAADWRDALVATNDPHNGGIKGSGQGLSAAEESCGRAAAGKKREETWRC